jgi:hypothetical protein
MSVVCKIYGKTSSYLQNVLSLASKNHYLMIVICLIESITWELVEGWLGVEGFLSMTRLATTLCAE